MPAWSGRPARSFRTPGRPDGRRSSWRAGRRAASRRGPTCGDRGVDRRAHLGGPGRSANGAHPGSTAQAGVSSPRADTVGDSAPASRALNGTSESETAPTAPLITSRSSRPSRHSLMAAPIGLARLRGPGRDRSAPVRASRRSGLPAPRFPGLASLSGEGRRVRSGEAASGPWRLMGARPRGHRLGARPARIEATPPVISCSR